MVELKAQDRLQPSLLDRLTDDQPEKTQEPVDKRVLSLSKLRDSVLRDLNWLFNCTQYSAGQDLSDYPRVESSVINYGLPAFSGFTASSMDVRAMEIAIRRAIIQFEPRLLPDSVRVKGRLSEDESNQHNVLSFDIECRLWALPAPIALYLRSDIDLESGRNAVREAG